MIKIVRGDLLQATENIIGHQVNCQAVMGSGVAKSIRDKFPKAYEEYMDLNLAYKKQNWHSDLLGQTQVVSIEINKKYIANMFGQFRYGYDGEKYTDTEALFNCFTTIRDYAERNNLSVALPYMIGCYRGGADWKEVEDLILTAFDGYEVTLYKLHRG